MSNLNIAAIKISDSQKKYQTCLNKANSHSGAGGNNLFIDTNEEAESALGCVLDGLKIEDVKNDEIKQFLRKTVDSKSSAALAFNDVIDTQEVATAKASLIKQFGAMQVLAWILLSDPENYVIDAFDFDKTKFKHAQKIEITTPWSASWSKTGLTAKPENGGIRISGNLADDCENYSWAVNKRVPKGEKYLSIDVSYTGDAGSWGNRCMFGLQVNGKMLRPVNVMSQPDGFINKFSGKLVFLLDDIDEIQTISIKTFAGKNINLGISNITVSSTTDKIRDKPPTLECFLNQIGFTASGKKQSVLAFSNKQTGLQPVNYQIIDKKTGKTVYAGKSSLWQYFQESGQTYTILDFTPFQTIGDYIVKVPKQAGIDKDTVSFDFSIRKTPAELFDKIRDDSLRTYLFWKCGDSCHHGDKYAVDFETNQKIDVSGGWHDAGDYGKYSVNAAYTLGMFFLGMEAFPTAFQYKIKGQKNDQVGIDDVIRPEVEWLQKMQRQDGAVYHKACSKDWPLNEVAADQDPYTKSVMPVSTTATADFAAVMAQASRHYKTSDPAFAKKCLDAAEKAWGFLEKNSDIIMIQQTYGGKEYGGPYIDRNDKDERLWAAVELFRATRNPKYQTLATNGLPKQAGNASKEGILDWANVNFFAYYSFFLDNPTANTSLKPLLQNYGDYLLKLQGNTPFGTTITGSSEKAFDWGSNAVVMTGAFQLMMTSKITGNSAYRKQARLSLDYVLGMNPLGYSFITGTGDKQATDPHFRPSMSKTSPLPKGFLIGGPNSVNIGGDVPLASIFNRPPAIRYVDDHWSWATNEVAINWNAPLVNVLSVVSTDTD